MRSSRGQRHSRRRFRQRDGCFSRLIVHADQLAVALPADRCLFISEGKREVFLGRCRHFQRVQRIFRQHLVGIIIQFDLIQRNRRITSVSFSDVQAHILISHRIAQVDDIKLAVSILCFIECRPFLICAVASFQTISLSCRSFPIQGNAVEGLRAAQIDFEPLRVACGQRAAGPAGISLAVTVHGHFIRESSV